jgi:FKBP-type peptidyl-prolyl cis-trans isomerase
VEEWFAGLKHLQVFKLYIFKRLIYTERKIFMRASRLYFFLAILSTFPVCGIAQLGLIKGEVFLKQNAKKEGVRMLPSGLQIKMIKEGEGRQPKPTDKVVVHYRGRLIDGKEFDSSYKRGQPAEFSVNGVIKGWTEGLQLLKEGGKAELYVPSHLAYGSRGSGALIGPDEALVFEVELISIK